MRQILINATFPNELRVAEVDTGYLSNMDIESYVHTRIQNNIYKGKIVKKDDSIEAFFVDFGDTRSGFLPFRNVSVPGSATSNEESVASLTKDDDIIVQVSIDKKEQEEKGAVLTTMSKLAGKFIVLLPAWAGKRQTPNSVQDHERAQVEKLIEQLDVPEDVGVSLRTSALSANPQVVKDELHALIRLWREIEQKAQESTTPALLWREHNAAIRMVLNRLHDDVDEVWIDTQEMFDTVKEWAENTIPEQQHKIQLYEEAIPLFKTYNIEAQINLAYERYVRLPSGGNVIIDHTAAITTIDINSSRGGASNMEETALKTNLEAIKEIARQLRLRDIGGQIVIDFIDMKDTKNCANVEQLFRQYMYHDPGNPNIANITDFCLMLMTRKRLRPSISDSFNELCQGCKGSGKMRNAHSVAMSLLRAAQDLAVKNKYISLLTSIPVASVLFNDYRESVLTLEQRYKVRLIVAADATMPQHEYSIKAGPNEEQCHVIKKYEHTKQHYVPPKTQRNNSDTAVVSNRYTGGNGFWRKLMDWLRLGNSKPVRIKTHRRAGQSKDRHSRGGRGRNHSNQNYRGNSRRAHGRHAQGNSAQSRSPQHRNPQSSQNRSPQHKPSQDQPKSV